MTTIKHIECQTGKLTNQIFHGTREATQLFNEHINDQLVIFLDHLWEVTLIDSFEQITKFVELIKEKKPNWKIFLMVNSACKTFEADIAQLNIDDVLFIDFFLYRVYNEVVVQKKSAFRQPADFVSYSKNKFLFLTGKAHKRHRIGLLKKFVDAGLMNFAEWSLFYFFENKNINPLVRQQLSTLSDDEFDEFIRTWARNPDNVNVKTTLNSTGFEYCGIPYDLRLYHDTDFSVISETSFSATTTTRNYNNLDNPWITEKVWIPILNKHPFIIAGDINILSRLKQLGFNTFEEFLKIPEYGQITDPDQRLNAIVENTRYFLENLNKHTTLINQYVNENYEQFNKLAICNLERILNFMEKHDLLDESVDTIVSTKDMHDDYQVRKKQDRLFALFYNNIKDPDWPNCETVDEFFQLPIHIQKECTTDFGYIPPTL